MGKRPTVASRTPLTAPILRDAPYLGAEAAAVRPAMKPKVIAGPSVPPAPQYAWPAGDAMQLPAPNRPGMGEPSGRSTRASVPITGPPHVSSVAGPRIA